MPTTSTDRTEARRRARQAARGEMPAEVVQPDPVSQPPARGGFLGKLFPPAPPLPGRLDPLKGFDQGGALRPVRERLFLLRANPWTWSGFGILAFLGFIASQYRSGSLFELVGTFGLFGSLIAAGWFGWQRPTLYGTTAGLVGFVLATVFILYAFAAAGASIGIFSADLASIALQGAYMAGLGFMGGWYGGYLRRRQAQLSTETRRRR